MEYSRNILKLPCKEGRHVERIDPVPTTKNGEQDDLLDYSQQSADLLHMNSLYFPRSKLNSDYILEPKHPQDKQYLC